MRSSYEGDKAAADALVPEATHMFAMVKFAAGGQSGQWKRPLSSGYCIVTLGNGIDGVHIVPDPGKDADIARVPRIRSGATLNKAQLTSIQTGVDANGQPTFAPALDCFNMSSNTLEEYGGEYPLVYSFGLPVPTHVSMPTRLDASFGNADSQYTLQQASKYTGKMCKLVQTILSYGVPRKQDVLSTVMMAIAQTNPSILFDLESTLFTKENLGGVQNQFQWEYACTHGVFEHIEELEDGTTSKENWLIEISKSNGVRAMPLQLEPATATPYFKAYIEAQCAKDEHKGFYDDIKLVLDEFGGYPTNEGFLTEHRQKIITLLAPGRMQKYEEGRGTGTDIGWAFNPNGTMANNICLEDMKDNWFKAHHCQIAIGYDKDTRLPTASYSVLESGSAPLGHGTFKVGDSILDACVSYNMEHLLHALRPDRAPATNTAMHVFYKNDKLIVLRYTDGHTDPATDVTETTGASDNSYNSYSTESWSGATGMTGGFFYDGYDGRLPNFGVHRKYEVERTLGGERGRTISYSPASDSPEYFSRSFWQLEVTKERIEIGSITWNNCAFLPLGDRSAFYIVNFTTEPSWTEQRTAVIRTVGDPYVYVVQDTYIWNFDFGTKCGTKYPFRFAGTTLDGLAEVVWDRSGARGRTQLDHYCQYYVRAPYGYIGGGYYAWSQTLQDALDKWTEGTGKSEWYSIGDEPHTTYNANDLVSPGDSYSRGGGLSRLKVHFFSMEKVGTVFERTGGYNQIFRDYYYWFDPSPNEDGDFQTMWNRRNCFGGAKYQLWSTDVNDSDLAIGGGYPRWPDNFPTFIGVVGDLAT